MRRDAPEHNDAAKGWPVDTNKMRIVGEALATRRPGPANALGLQRGVDEDRTPRIAFGSAFARRDVSPDDRPSVLRFFLLPKLLLSPGVPTRFFHRFRSFVVPNLSPCSHCHRPCGCSWPVA